ncbi:MAG: DNA translocase FtsK 4TM domain-containing protein, partial [Phycisphaerae bacterium]
MKEKKSYEAAAEYLGIAAVLIILCSCISFNIGDWPSKFVWPHNDPPANWCGRTGAFIAYYLMYYVGPGVFVILISAICVLAARLANQSIGQGVLRTIGLLLVTAAASSSFYLIRPHGVFSFPMGSGGVLGVAAAEFLRGHFALLGTFILITATWLVGTVLLADTFVAATFGWFGFAAGRMVGVASPVWSAARQQSQALSEIWQKLSTRQRQLSAEAEEVQSENEFDEDEDVAIEDVITPAEPAKPRELKLTLPQVRKPAKPYVPTSYEDYQLPPMELLSEPEHTFASVQEKIIKAKASALEKLLTEFNINAHVVAADTGPV